jgi:hypothetical protein
VNRLYNRAVAVFSTLFVVLGFALLIRTALAGGGIGYVLGFLFVALGSARLFLMFRQKL